MSTGGFPKDGPMDLKPYEPKAPVIPAAGKGPEAQDCKFWMPSEDPCEGDMDPALSDTQPGTAKDL